MNSFGPKISVVIPTWNGLDHLRECLPSLLAQSFQDFETLVVDNGSTDDTRDYVHHNFPEVKVLTFDTNRGFSAAANAGIRQAKGHFIALLNNDTRVDTHWLRELLHAVGSNEHVDCFASKILRWEDPSILDSAGDAYDRRGMAWNVGGGHRDGLAFQESRWAFSACAAAALYRRRFFEEVGLFDEDFFAFYEDVDLGFRGQLMRRQCLYVPTAVVHHHGGGTLRHLSKSHLYYCTRNAALVLVKNMPFIVLMRNLPRIVLAHTRHLGGHLLRSPQRWGVVSGYIMVLLQITRMLRKRRWIQRHRLITNEELQSLLRSQKFLARPKAVPEKGNPISNGRVAMDMRQ